MKTGFRRHEVIPVGHQAGAMVLSILRMNLGLPKNACGPFLQVHTCLREAAQALHGLLPDKRLSC